MTQGDKDLVHRIQLSQLQTDHPYLDDYYYHTYNSSQLKNSDSKATEKKFLPKMDGTKRAPDKITESKY